MPSRVKFVAVFVACAFAFVFCTTMILDQAPDSFLGSATQKGWQSIVSTLVSPIKIVLLGPLIPFINFLHQDPDTPPPFFLAGFAAYWTLLGAFIHFFVSKIKRKRGQVN